MIEGRGRTAARRGPGRGALGTGFRVPTPAWHCAARSGRRRRGSRPDSTSESSTRWLKTRPRVDSRLASMRSALTTRRSMTSVIRASAKSVDDGGVRQDDPLGRGVADVAFVPQGDVLEPDLGVAAQQSGQAGHVLRPDRVALVGHGRRALLALGEGFHRPRRSRNAAGCGSRWRIVRASNQPAPGCSGSGRVGPG